MNSEGVHTLTLGQRVQHRERDFGIGTIRYIGKVDGTKDDGQNWIGIEWDDPTCGTQNGGYNGKQYFTIRSKNADSTGGSFLKPNKVDTGVSFSEALESKFADEREYGIRIAMKKLIERDSNGCFPNLQNLILASQRISALNSDLKSRVPNLTDLHLGQNLLSNLSDIQTLAEQLPHLKHLNLSENHFQPTSDKLSLEFTHDLERLHLNGTFLCWENVNSVLRLFPKLREIHLAQNEFEQCDLRPECAPHLERLHLNDNRITSWIQVTPLASLPSLKALVLQGNPLEDGDQEKADRSKLFPHLVALNISHTRLRSWGAIRAIVMSTGATDVRVHDVPATESFSEDVIRKISLAMLSNVQCLNGGKISARERIFAERFVIREYFNNPDFKMLPADRCAELEKVYGRLAPLADVDLSAPTHVNVFIRFQTNFPSQLPPIYHRLELNQPVAQLRAEIAESATREFRVEYPVQDIRIFHVDKEVEAVYGREEMKDGMNLGTKYYENCCWKYKLHDNDEITVACKHAKASHSLLPHGQPNSGKTTTTGSAGKANSKSAPPVRMMACHAKKRAAATAARASATANANGIADDFTSACAIDAAVSTCGAEPLESTALASDESRSA
eukprot:TRINITY_DN5835_c0_g1::TRINITY_DN5835_c0_g1_i1::g.24429::m.24429 TRINITY_DN5835_c0_g1::TRINITY_DN5835_c0_g1_i1::g.24429  ORF type:complete len:618 (-),score=68.05,sp/Q8GRL7/TBCE_ARATH/29.21/2e-38,LRR_4/PF12799.2/0.083,LRR_4/PF12799.2/0.00028,LRR_4/PF12799.2/2.5,LRR_4/PF12799.2/2.8e-08,LRR_4/PF12799.2/2e+02,CAP_GLY/PF01302.20/4e-16,CAP_GLY/PF01302.20/4e+03,LRR_8/PF13855.1/0.00015,LRR_8/PF13855.1/96,LRR_8/PF13855.1/1.1e-06,LRR_9/PF14580.1/0.0027,LRR_9/PF14580.1/1.5,LRR_6/PF13516.1/3e+03,LRR_6/PF135